MPNSGSNNLTTYYAKRIIGDTAAESAAKALLQTGTDIATNTWILSRTNRSNTYGIKYVYDNTVSGTNDKIELYGNYLTGNNDTNTPTAWVNLHTGYTYILGQVGIGYNPEDNNNNYKLYVNGTSYFYGTTYLNDQVGIGYDPETSGNTYKLYVNGTSYFNDNARINGNLYFEANKDIYFNYNSTDWPILDNANNGNVSLNACGDKLLLGYNKTSYIYMYYTNSDNSTRTKFFEINSDGAYALTRFGVNGQNTSYNLYVDGSTYHEGDIYLGGDNGSDIYYAGTQATHRMIRFIDNTADTSGNGISIGGGGLTVLGSGESANTILSNLSLTSSGGTETTYICSDGDIEFYSTQQSYNVNYKLTLGNGQFQRAGKSVSWYQGRDTAIIKSTSYSGYDSLVSLKTTSGDWSLGVYTDNILYFTYILDSNYSANSNTITKQFYFKPDGTIGGNSFTGNSATASKLLDSNNTAKTITPSYYSGGVSSFDYATVWNGYHLTYITKANLMSQIRSAASGSWGINITGSAGSATYASSYLANRGNVSGSTHAEALKAYFNSNKSSEPRNALVAHYSSAYGNGSLCMGYFLSGYDSGPYGGFFVCHYNSPKYVGISGGTYTQYPLLTNINGTERSLQVRYGGVTLNNNSQTTVTFSPAFSNACLAVIPYDAHLGFAAPQAISVGSITKSNCKMYQYNAQGAACAAAYVAIGY